jgi:hypothetical protein
MEREHRATNEQQLSQEYCLQDAFVMLCLFVAPSVVSWQWQSQHIQAADTARVILQQRATLCGGIEKGLGFALATLQRL